MKTKTNQNKPTGRDISPRINTTIFCLIAAVMFAAMLDSRAGTITNMPPVAVNDALQRNEDSPLRVRVAKLLANDTNPDGDALGLSSVSATSTAGGTIVRRARWIAYRPLPGFTNADSFSYVITNSHGLMATGSVSITVRADLERSENVAASEILGNGDSRIQFVGIPGRLYRIQYSNSVETPRWRPLVKRLADETGQFECIDPSAPGSIGRIYRSTYP